MGPIGMPEMFMIFIVLALLAVPVVIVIALVWYFGSRNKPPQLPSGPSRPLDRLAELEALRSRNLISDAEHEEKRRQILSEI